MDDRSFIAEIEPWRLFFTQFLVVTIDARLVEFERNTLLAIAHLQLFTWWSCWTSALLKETEENVLHANTHTTPHHKKRQDKRDEKRKREKRWKRDGYIQKTLIRFFSTSHSSSSKRFLTQEEAYLGVPFFSSDFGKRRTLLWGTLLLFGLFGEKKAYLGIPFFSTDFGATRSLPGGTLLLFGLLPKEPHLEVAFCLRGWSRNHRTLSGKRCHILTFHKTHYPLAPPAKTNTIQYLIPGRATNVEWLKRVKNWQSPSGTLGQIV